MSGKEKRPVSDALATLFSAKGGHRLRKETEKEEGGGGGGGGGGRQKGRMAGTLLRPPSRKEGHSKGVEGGGGWPRGDAWTTNGGGRELIVLLTKKHS